MAGRRGREGPGGKSGYDVGEKQRAIETDVKAVTVAVKTFEGFRFQEKEKSVCSHGAREKEC